MFFLCFSGVDRMAIVTSVLYHTRNYGLTVWFDNHEYYIGDQKISTYVKAIQESRYAIVIFSDTFSSSPGAIEELEVIKGRYDDGKIHIFPIFYKIKAIDVPERYNWLTSMIYNELGEDTGTILTCNQFICKYLSDVVSELSCPHLRYYISSNNTKNSEYFLAKIIQAYYDIAEINICARMSILYCIFEYAETQCTLPDVLKKSASYLFSLTKLNIHYDFKEIAILEHIVVISLDIMMNKHHPKFALLHKQ